MATIRAFGVGTLLAPLVILAACGVPGVGQTPAATRAPIVAASQVADVAAQAARQGAVIDAASEQGSLGTLLGVYERRDDLQRAFGGLDRLNLTALIGWAATDGVSVDRERATLAPYRTEYLALAAATSRRGPIYVRVPRPS